MLRPWSALPLSLFIHGGFLVLITLTGRYREIHVDGARLLTVLASSPGIQGPGSAVLLFRLRNTNRSSLNAPFVHLPGAVVTMPV